MADQISQGFKDQMNHPLSTKMLTQRTNYFLVPPKQFELKKLINLSFSPKFRKVRKSQYYGTDKNLLQQQVEQILKNRKRQEQIFSTEIIDFSQIGTPKVFFIKFQQIYEFLEILQGSEQKSFKIFQQNLDKFMQLLIRDKYNDEFLEIFREHNMREQLKRQINLSFSLMICFRYINFDIVNPKVMANFKKFLLLIRQFLNLCFSLLLTYIEQFQLNNLENLFEEYISPKMEKNDSNSSIDIESFLVSIKHIYFSTIMTYNNINPFLDVKVRNHLDDLFTNLSSLNKSDVFDQNISFFLSHTEEKLVQ